MSRLDDQLAELATLPAADLRGLWERVYKTPAPRLSADLLRMGVAYRLQERVLGKLPPRIARALRQPAASPGLKPGTELVRSWNGRTITVTVQEDGYLYDGNLHRSLSGIAKLVTGATWSGPRFFGIKADG